MGDSAKNIVNTGGFFNNRDMSRLYLIYDAFNKRERNAICLLANPLGIESFNSCYLIYQSCEIKLSILKGLPTRTELRLKQEKILKASQKLLMLLKETNDETNSGNSHFYNSIVSCLRNASNTLDIEDSVYDETMETVLKLSYDLTNNLTLFNAFVSSSLEPDIEYSDVKPPKKVKNPQTLLIQNLSGVLTMYFGEGGYTRGNSDIGSITSGWRIECVDYLLFRIGLSVKPNKILDAILDDRNKKKVKQCIVDS